MLQPQTSRERAQNYVVYLYYIASHWAHISKLNGTWHTVVIPWYSKVSKYTTIQKFEVSKIFLFLKEVSYAHQGCIYLIKKKILKIFLQFKITACLSE